MRLVCSSAPADLGRVTVRTPFRNDAPTLFINVPIERYPPLEMAVITLAEPPIVFFALASPFPIDGQHVVRQLDPYVLLIQTGKFRYYFDFLSGLRHFDIRPATFQIGFTPLNSKRSGSWLVEGAAEYLLEQPVHFAVKCQQWVHFIIASHLKFAAAKRHLMAGNELSDVHCDAPEIVLRSSASRADERPHPGGFDAGRIRPV
jgi:hypothetical protein